MNASIYEVEFICSGAVGYPESNETYYIRDEALSLMAPTLIGKPVYLTHESSVPIGHVTDVKKKENGYYTATLSIFNEEANKKLENGYSFSSAYIVTEGNENVEINQIPYKYEVLNGEYHHIAVVENPRFSEISFRKLNSKGGNRLNFFKSNNIRKKENNLSEDKHFVLIDDTKVMVNELVSLYQKKKLNEVYMVKPKDSIQIDGEEVAIASLISLYKENTNKNETKEECSKENEVDEDTENNFTNKLSTNEVEKPKSFKVLKDTVEKVSSLNSLSYFSLNKQEQLGKERY